jgi:cell division protein FtsL
MSRGSGAIRMGMALTLLFASLSMVVWRQSRALEELRGLDAARSSRAVLQAERTALQREIQRLESRSRIIAVAGDRFGLRMPAGSEIVILQAPARQNAGAAPARPPRRDLLTTAERH